MSQSAAVIDLDAYRRRRQASPASPAVFRGVPLVWVLWFPVWLWR